MEIEFGPYRLSCSSRLLFGPDGPLDVSARSFDILVALIGQPDTVVSKKELFDRVWPDIVVGENTLQVHISALRRALGNNFITTVHGRGYKYTGPAPGKTVAKSGAAPSDEVRSDDEGLRQPVGTGLFRIRKRDAPARAVTEQLAEARQILRG